MSSSKFSMPLSKVSYIKDLNDSTDRWRVVVRVIRRWNVYQKDTPTELFCISMLFVDEEGGRIQASIMNKSLFNEFKDFPCERKIYFMANFVLSDNNKEYRATNHPFKITVGSQTFLKEVDASILEYSYLFFSISDIIEVKGKNHIDYLIDVIGFVAFVGSLEQYCVNNETKNKIRLTIADDLGNTVSCVFYDECAVNVCMNDFMKMEAPVVILIQLGRIGFAEDGTPEVCSSYNATKVAFNLKLPEVKNFIYGTKVVPSPTISSNSLSIPSQCTNPFASNLLQSHPIIKIEEIPNQDVDEYFLIECEILKLDTRHGWYYDGCSRCGSKARFQGGKVFCPSNMCKSKTVNMEPKMKVHYIVKDVSGKASVVFFDKFVVQFIGKTGLQLKKQLEMENRGYDFPDELDILVGKKLLLKLELNKYNRDYPNSSISVASYTELTDLMDDFNEAAQPVVDVVEEHSDGMMEESDRANQSAPFDSAPLTSQLSDQEIISLDNTPISSLSTTATYKGKRKNAGKKSVVWKEKSVPDIMISPVKNYSKPLKSIKQEKI